jgi:signal transduction histidine kinase
MKKLWSRANFRIKNQVLLRALPVLMLSAVLMGVTGWLVFTRNATELRKQRSEALLQSLPRQVEEAVVRHCLTLDAGLADAPALVCGLDEKVPGFVVPCSDSLEAPGVPAGAPSAQQLLHWGAENAPYLQGDYSPGSEEARQSPGAPHLAALGRSGRMLLFPPLVANGQAWQPALIQGCADPALYFLPLADLMPTLPGDGWLCLLDHQGRVLHSNDPLLVVGQPIPPEARAAVVQARALPGLGISLETTVPGSGFRILYEDPMRDMGQATATYMLILLLAAILAVAGTTLVLNRVLGRTSAQLRNLTGNMEALAKGQFSGRMGKPDNGSANDEVGSLSGFFNLMASSLEESQRQIKERASHLRAALENMRMLDQAKDDFLVLISHEVRTPLTAIRGGVDYLRKAVEKVEGEDQRVLDSINLNEITEILHSSSERLSEFMTDAIQMTSLGSRETKLNLRPMPVRDLVGQCLSSLQPLAEDNAVTIHNQLAEGGDWCLLCDPEVLGVGLEKILHNAVQHNHQGGVVHIREAAMVPGMGGVADLIDADCLGRLEAQTRFRIFEDEDLVWRLVEVYNTGKPIPQERRPALFGKFELVGRIENHSKGSGLSLPIAKAAVESHGGRILLSSDDQEGNSFFLLLPTMEGAAVAQLESGTISGRVSAADPGTKMSARRETPLRSMLNSTTFAPPFLAASTSPAAG